MNTRNRKPPAPLTYLEWIIPADFTDGNLGEITGQDPYSNAFPQWQFQNGILSIETTTEPCGCYTNPAVIEALDSVFDRI